MSDKTKEKDAPAECRGKIELTPQFDPAFFKALGDQNRIAILVELAKCSQPQTVSQMTRCCSVDLSVVSRHLATLREAGIVASEKRGREVYYWVRFPDLTKRLRQMADAIEACCPGDYASCSGPGED